MPLDNEIILFGTALFAALLIIIIFLLRLSNHLIVTRLDALAKRQMALEKINKKIVSIIASNRKELEKKITNPDIGLKENEAEEAEKMLAVAGKKR